MVVSVFYLLFFGFKCGGEYGEAVRLWRENSAVGVTTCYQISASGTSRLGDLRTRGRFFSRCAGHAKSALMELCTSRNVSKAGVGGHGRFLHVVSSTRRKLFSVIIMGSVSHFTEGAMSLLRGIHGLGSLKVRARFLATGVADVKGDRFILAVFKTLTRRRDTGASGHMGFNGGVGTRGKQIPGVMCKCSGAVKSCFGLTVGGRRSGIMRRVCG